MRQKNTQFLERHIEKIILAAAALFAVAVISLYIFRNPYTVEVNQLPLSAEEVENGVSRATQNLEKRIQDPNSPLPSMPALNYSQPFSHRLRHKPVDLALTLPLSRPGLGLEVLGPESGDPRLSYFVPPTPPPAPPSVRQGVAVLIEHDALVEKIGAETAQAYAQWIPTDPPRDFQYVIIEGEYDFQGWTQALQVLPSEGQVIPQEWWRALQGIVEVVVERQALLDPKNDQWGETQVVAPLPGSLDLGQSREEWTAEDAKNVIQKIQENQDAISRSDPPPTLNVIVPPDPASPARPAPRRTTGRAPARPGPTGAANPTDLSLSKVTLRAFDLTAEAGREYRYRIRVKLINPLFRRDINKEQKALYFNRLALDSEPSPWSPPVRINPRSYFFVLDASVPQQEARVEVWRLFNGQMRSKEFKVRPGDAIGGPVTLVAQSKEYEIDMSTPAILVDVAESTPGTTASSLSATGIGSAPPRRESVTILCFDQQSGLLVQRDAEVDRISPLRASLARDAADPNPAGPSNATPTSR